MKIASFGTCAALACLCGASQETLNAQTTTSTPTPARGSQVDVYHGERIPDPYRWMEDMGSAETRAWITAQDQHARQFASAWPWRDSVRARVARFARTPSIATLGQSSVKENGRYFYSRLNNTGANPVYAHTVMRASLTSPARIIIDGDAFQRQGFELRRVQPAPDGRHVLYATTRKGGEWETVRIRDVDTGRDLADEVTGVHRVSGFSWARRGPVGFYYTRLPVPDIAQQRRALLNGGAIYFHRLGTPQSQDELVYERPDRPEWYMYPRVTDDGRYLFITAAPGSSLTNHMFYKDLTRRDSPISRLFDVDAGQYRYVGSLGKTLWFETRVNAPNGRVIAIDIDKPQQANWVTAIPESEDVIDTWGRSGAFSVGGHLVVLYRVDARLEARVFDANGKHRYSLELPYRFPSVWSGVVGLDSDPEGFLIVQGLADNGTLYQLDVRTGKLQIVERSRAPYDLNDLVSEQVFATSKDGTRVPMVIIRHKDTRVDGTAPGLIYGYGAQEWIASPWFQPGVAQWVYMGGVWALPGLRGGGEYGRRWTEAGRGRNKQNAIDDFIAAAEYLVTNKYVAPKKIVANGSSLGGQLAGAAIVQRADLFGAAILDYPVLDMLRYDQFAAGARWADEFGSLSNADDYRAIRAYSPLHTIREGVCYPPTLIAPGENDHTAAPVHAYKFAATLQHANASIRGCSNPVTLRVSWGAGHNSGATVEESVDTWTDEISFLARVLNFTPTWTRMAAPDQ